MKKVGIIGMGRFGKTLLRLFEGDFEISVYDKSTRAVTNLKSSNNIKIVKNVKSIFDCEVIFYSIPISEFEKVINNHKKYFASQLIVDVLSVKVHPKKVLEKHLTDTKVQALLTHPMFGPDSSKDGFKGLPIIIDKFKTESKNHDFWINYFSRKGLRVIPMTADEHDKLAASSQGLTHFVGRLLDDYGLKPSEIDSLGTKRLLEVKSQTINDTWQLFYDLQHFNPYTKKMRIRLGERYDLLYSKLLPNRVDLRYVTIGIQGGKGSFNEKAVSYYLKQVGVANNKIKYLHTSENVLKSLHAGNIDYGQFAIHNSVGGIVEESVEAMANYKFKIVKQFALKISHSLMIRSDTKLKDIDTIMSHPQVFAQCKKTLTKKYPKLRLVSGKGKLIDHALVAREMAFKKIPENVATMGSNILSEIYNLKVVENDLQDAKDNYTSFLIVERI